MKKHIFLLILMLMPVLASAEEVGGINYTLYNGTTPTAAVSDKSPKYSGNIVIPKSFVYNGKTYVVTEIENWAFSSCTELTSLSIPATVNEIGACVVSYSSGLLSIVVDPDNLVYDSRNNCNAIIETKTNKLIAGCNNTVIPATVTEIGDDAFQDMDGLTSLIIPNGVTTIGSQAFNMCDGITSFVIPNSVTTIAYAAFSWMENLRSVTIGSGVEKIEIDAFQDCRQLTEVTLLAETPPTVFYEYEEDLDDDEELDAFSSYGYPSLRSGITLYVPASAVNAYKADAYWSTFKEIVALPNKCAKPTISYANGKVTFSCATEGVEFHSTVSKSFSGDNVDPTGDYVVSVYATKADYEDSDIATAVVKLGSSARLKGDVNEDGSVTVTDAVAVVNIVLGGSSATPANSEGDQAVDLGLSVKWAPMNVGASAPEEYGGLYAWGELEEKTGSYTWENYMLGNGTTYNDPQFTKYCSLSSNGTVDNKTVLEAEDDVARQKYGNNKEWRTPTKEELYELVERCTWAPETLNGVSGYRVTGPSGNSIFLPYAGQNSSLGLMNRGSAGYLSSATLDDDTSRYCYCFYNTGADYISYTRQQGLSVRPVYAGAAK